MSSIINGFEYDVFISYRQNDNRSGWVTEFVKALEEELAATIKEPISIYFDVNPHDGLLETHDVNKSLEGKLKCLIFIPILSQTYCDPKSFAWQHEFCPFNKLANEDPFGRDIKLNNGNVASRILPIKIHDLDPDDETLLCSQLGGPLRSLDFIYQEPGVNRPLKPSDAKAENINKSNYRNQINKVANSIKDIFIAIQHPNRQIPHPVTLISREVSKKSIVVLPFINMSNDPEQEYFSDGLTEEIITDLSNLNDLLVISRGSAMTFKGSKLRISDIANEVNVRYALEGSVRRSGTSLRISVQLIDSVNDSHVWAEKYNESIEDIFSIQEKVSRAVVTSLKLKLTPEEDQTINHHAFSNVQAFEWYLQAKAEMLKWNPAAIQKALALLQNSLDHVGPNPILHGGMAYAYWSLANLGLDAITNFTKAEEYVKKVFEENPESPEGYLVDGLLNQTQYANQGAAIRSFKKVLQGRPNDAHAMTWLVIGFSICGKMQSAAALGNRLVSIDPLSPISRMVPTLIRFYSGQFEASSKNIYAIFKSEPENSFWKYFTVLCFVNEGKPNEALKFIDEYVPAGDDAIVKLTLAFKHILNDEPSLFIGIIKDPDVKQAALIDCQYSQFVSSMCARAGFTEEALHWLDNAIQRGFLNYTFIREGDPGYQHLRVNLQFQKLVDRAAEDFRKIEG